MWLTHTYFSIYLFHDFIYGFRYPLLIYVVLVAVSLVTAVAIIYLSRKVCVIRKLILFFSVYNRCI